MHKKPLHPIYIYLAWISDITHLRGISYNIVSNSTKCGIWGMPCYVLDSIKAWRIRLSVREDLFGMVCYIFY